MATMQPVTPLLLRQRTNYLNALLAVEERARKQNWGKWEAHHAAMMVTMCGLAEANFHNYGNHGAPESYQLADRQPWGGRYISYDYDSAGVLQQRPSWGTLHDRMTPRHAAHTFMDRATVLGVDRPNGIPTREDVQKVQVSFDWTGWNYGVQLLRARALMRRYWDTEHQRIRTDRQRRRAANWHFPK